MTLKTTQPFVSLCLRSKFFKSVLPDVEDDCKSGFVRCVGSWEGKWKEGRKGCVSTGRNDQHCGFRQFWLSFPLPSSQIHKVSANTSPFYIFLFCMMIHIYLKNKNLSLSFYGPLFHSGIVFPVCSFFVVKLLELLFAIDVSFQRCPKILYAVP